MKNEIEYLHTKINTSFDDANDDFLQKTRFEREFTTGKVTSDYQKLLHEQAKVKLDEQKQGKRFKILVEGG